MIVILLKRDLNPFTRDHIITLISVHTAITSLTTPDDVLTSYSRIVRAVGARWVDVSSFPS